MTCIGLVLLSLGASPYQVWQEVYDGGKVDMGHGLCLDSSEHIVVVGETNQASNYDCWIITMSESGDSLWSWFYDDGSDEEGIAITTTTDGSIAIVGHFGQGMMTILYDPEGNPLWERHSYTGQTTVAKSIDASSDSIIYSLGYHLESVFDHLFISGFNSKGELTMFVDERDAFTRVTDLVPLPSGYVYVGSDDVLGSCALWLYSSPGEREWLRVYEHTSAKAFALEINEANHLFQSGDFYSTNYDFLLLKWTTGGALVWPEHKAYDLGDYEYCRDIKLDAISDCYLAGWQARGSEEDIALVKTDSAGNMLWAWVDTVEGQQEIEGIEVDADGYIYLAGSHHNGDNWDILVMKVRQPLTISGRVTDSTDAPMEGIPVSLTGDTAVEVLTDTGGYYLIEVYNGGEYTVSPNLPGWSFTPSSYQYAPLAHREFDQDFEGRWTGIEESPLLLEFDLQVADNRILYQVPYLTHVKIGVYDIAGRLVLEVVDEEVKPGRHCFEWKGRDCASRTVASGIYFVKMTTDEYKKTHKMVILK